MQCCICGKSIGMRDPSWYIWPGEKNFQICEECCARVQDIAVRRSVSDVNRGQEYFQTYLNLYDIPSPRVKSFVEDLAQGEVKQRPSSAKKNQSDSYTPSYKVSHTNTSSSSSYSSMSSGAKSENNAISQAIKIIAIIGFVVAAIFCIVAAMVPSIVYLYVAVGCAFACLLLLGFAEIIKLLYEISKKLDRSSK